MAGEYITFNNNTQPALNDTNINRMQQLIKQDIQGAVSGDTLPVGAIMPFGSDTIPENWLLCDGQAVSRTDYQELFNTIGTTYGSGDGFTTFNLPNLQGKIPVGKDENDTDFDTLGNTGGEKEHTLTVEEIPPHNHTIKNGTNGNDGGSDWAVSNTGASNWKTANTGGGQPHNILQPYIVQNYIIKAKQSAGVVATVVDGLNSTSATDALSAKQGKILKEIIEGTVLYENSEGTKENVTLNDSASDYSYIEIFYSIPDEMMKSVKVYNPNDKSVILDGVWFGDDLYFYTKRIKIEANMINKRTARTYRILNSTTWTPYGSETDNITIYKVVGYK